MVRHLPAPRATHKRHSIRAVALVCSPYVRIPTHAGQELLLAVAASPTPATTASPTALVIRAVPAVVITWRIVTAIAATGAAAVIPGRVVRAVSAAATVISRLCLTRGNSAQGRKPNAHSRQARKAHHGLPPCHCALCFLVHRTPACPSR